MANTVYDITLEEATKSSYTKESNTFFWRTKENIFGDAHFSEGFDFNSLCVMWGRHTYAYTCYMQVNQVLSTNNVNTIMVGINKNNGYFASLEELRKAYPKLFEVKGEFTGLLVTL